MNYWIESLLPSVQSVKLSAKDVAHVKTPVLIIHGKKDRSAPYGGAREWALMLPHAMLLTVTDAAHAPWIEAPEQVLGPIQTFLNGSWPPSAHKVEFASDET